MTGLRAHSWGQATSRRPNSASIAATTFRQTSSSCSSSSTALASSAAFMPVDVVPAIARTSAQKLRRTDGRSWSMNAAMLSEDPRCLSTSSRRRRRPRARGLIRAFPRPPFDRRGRCAEATPDAFARSVQPSAWWVCSRLMQRRPMRSAEGHGAGSPHSGSRMAASRGKWCSLWASICHRRCRIARSMMTRYETEALYPRISETRARLASD